jgi:uncharacterized membrane protein YphA (DoxX/SURF4 family)
VLAGATKLADRRAFHAAVAEYDILPARLRRPFATFVPVAEIALGSLLLLGLLTVVAAGLAAPLFLSFSIAIGANMLRGRSFDCHCFGSAHSDRIGWPALLRSVLLVLAAVFVAAGATRFGALDALVLGSSGLPDVSEIIPVVFAAFVIIDVLFLLPELVAVQTAFRQMRASRTHGHGQAHGASA